jgi:pimeloyl-ACP methyl ester carboxylesterase
VSTARNGEIDIYYEVFGDPSRPTLLLINGLGSQCINYAPAWCQLFCDEGFQVVRVRHEAPCNRRGVRDPPHRVVAAIR